MEFTAPAKINLSLRVLGKREDGFHDVETLMAPLSLADRLFIDVADTGEFEFTCNDSVLADTESNLAARAARLFMDRTGKRPGLTIHLEKHVPYGAGLGGGSSDAATVLLGLNRLLSTGLEQEQLAELAAELGSDVAFFIHESVARCGGRGEVVTPVSGHPSAVLVLLKPPFGVPTPWAYQQWRDAREVPGFHYAAQKLPWGELVNDLERPVFEKFLFLGILKKWLLAQPETSGALMSGSGSTCFAVVSDEAAGTRLAARAGDEFGKTIWTKVCSTVASAAG